MAFKIIVDIYLPNSKDSEIFFLTHFELLFEVYKITLTLSKSLNKDLI